jgi:hypothetical protein
VWGAASNREPTLRERPRTTMRRYCTIYSSYHSYTTMYIAPWGFVN